MAVASTLSIGQLDAACVAMVHLAQHAHNPSSATYGNRLGAVQLRGYTDLARLVLVWGDKKPTSTKWSLRLRILVNKVRMDTKDPLPAKNPGRNLEGWTMAAFGQKLQDARLIR